MERMKTDGSVACSCIRTRSARIAPPEKGDDGSIASTPTWETGSSAVRSPAGGQPRRATLTSWFVSVDLPDPGAPVIPTV